MARQSAFLIGLLALLVGGVRAEDTTVDLILVAGQSNAVGYDAKPTELPPSAIDQEVLFWWRCGDPPPDEHDSVSMSRWTHLQPQPLGNPKQPKSGRQYGNFAQAEGGFGPEIGLARALRKNSDQRLAIVKAAFSGTGMRTDWNPEDTGDGGACYRALVSETKAAIAAAESDGIKLRIRALAWVQGESDANAQDAENYQQALAKMLKSLRRDLATPDLIAMLAVNTRFGGGNNAYMPKIIESQQDVAANDERCAYVDTSAASIANNVHYDAAGTLEVGRMFAEALIKIENAE
ncbi:MAG TPA: sialate O-acetylesterase [Pirellulaceae bacterium]|nr:sialate O-acetylesterase [Pirellulaceae bacterium]